MSLQRIPFLKQHRAKGHRMCGAAALSMAYRSLDLSCSRQEAWGEVARRDRHGRLVARTHLLARDAIRRGLAAVVVQVADPWPVLGRAVAAEVRVILNHRLETGSSLGHYTILVDVRDEHLTLHDPHFGPFRRIERSEFLDLWLPRPWLKKGSGIVVRSTRPTFGRCPAVPATVPDPFLSHGLPGSDPSEIVGHVLVGITTRSELRRNCTECGTEVPQSATCPDCGATIRLRPLAVLGCIRADCDNRMWHRVFCPECDRGVSQV